MSPPSPKKTKAKPVSKGRPRAAKHTAKGSPSKRSKRSVAQTGPPVKPGAAEGSSESQLSGDRIAKVIARAGLCSRREAERWIDEGRVEVNGQVLPSPAYGVKPRDRIKVDGVWLPAREPVRLWRYYKPRGLVTTHRDPQGRKTVFDALPDTLPRVISVGRLDFNTEGLLLLTNDGDLARHLELPSTGWLRRYRVRAHGAVSEEQLQSLSEGIVVDGVKYGPIEAALDSKQGSNQWLSVGLREGKNREVRNVLGALGLDVNRLIRISYGPFQLLDLKPGQTELVRRKTLAEQLGPALAETFELDGEEVMPPRTARKHRAKPVAVDDGRRKQTSSKPASRKAKTRPTRVAADRKPHNKKSPKPGRRK